MRKLIFHLTLLCLFLLTVSVPLQAKDKIGSASVNTEAEAAKAKVMLSRLDEINAIDKSTLNSAEKRQLRKEVKALKSNLNELGGGVYISVGAILLVIILLILLL